MKMWIGILWYVLWHPRTAVLYYRQIQTVHRLVQSPLMPYIKRAVCKTMIDPSFHSTKDHALKRNEAIEWTGHYLRDAGLLNPKVTWPTWEVSFLIEWAVGEVKGKL